MPKNLRTTFIEQEQAKRVERLAAVTELAVNATKGWIEPADCPDDIVADQFAAKYLPGCPDCRGSGLTDEVRCPRCGELGECKVHLHMSGRMPCDHRNAPTLADLLLIGIEAHDHQDYLWAVGR